MTNERHIIFYSGLLIFLQHNIILNGNPNGLLHSMKPLFYLNTQYFIILRLVNIFFFNFTWYESLFNDTILMLFTFNNHPFVKH